MPCLSFIITLMSELRDEKEKNIAKVCGRNLRNLRLRYDYSQKQLAEHLGCSEETVGKYERGVQTMKYWRLIRVCDLFHVSLDYLLRDFDSSDPGVVPSYVVKLFRDADETDLEILSRHLLTAEQMLDLVRPLKNRSLRQDE